MSDDLFRSWTVFSAETDMNILIYGGDRIKNSKK